MNSNAIKERTIKLYKNAGWKSLFAYIRFWDAPIVKLETFIPKSGVIIELGCGDGFLSNYLAIASSERKVIGIDFDKKRIKEANKKIPNTKFLYGDISAIKIPTADSIILSHVLHHLNSYIDQEKVLRESLIQLKKGGKLIIMEIYPKASIKYLLGWFFDHFLVPIFFEGRMYSKIYYRKRDEWKKLLEGMGTKVETFDVTAGKPISNIIIISTK